MTMTEANFCTWAFLLEPISPQSSMPPRTYFPLDDCLYTSKYNMTTTKRAYFAFDMPLGMANPFIFTTQLKILYRINQIAK